MNFFENCTLCPRKCGVNRVNGETGFCGETSKIKAARAALHHWEEPCISGERGSGTVFFSGCNLGCIFCQNHEISRGQAGKEVSPERLFDVFFELKEQGAHNINLVTPTPFLPTILDVVKKAKKENIGIPFILNCGGYESVEMLKEAEGLIDVYLPDFKYISADLAEQYSRAKDYPEVAKTALFEMVRQRPKCVFSEDGMIVKGVIVRHLILPGCVKDSKDVLSYLHRTYKDQIYVSIMNQYTPVRHLSAYPKLNRPVTMREYERVLEHALSIGIEQAFVQEGETAKEGFIPAFDHEGV